MTEELYIPFWLYSNRSKLNALYAFVTFTFHSGYIPMNTIVRLKRNLLSLYIPFWLYSNNKHRLELLRIYQLYIPFWLYSNGYGVTCSRRRRSFTFHSGYIPIRLLSYHLFAPFKTLFFVYLDFFCRQSMIFL